MSFSNLHVSVITLDALLDYQSLPQTKIVPVELSLPDIGQIRLKCYDMHHSNNNHFGFVDYKKSYPAKVKPKQQISEKEHELGCLLSVIRYHNDFELYFKMHQKFNFCKVILPVEYDFYCVVIRGDKVAQFVIELDHPGHGYFSSQECIDSHIRDIIKQYYLWQMGIHLLRLRNDCKNFRLEIEKFVSTVLNSENYVACNPIIAQKEYFYDVFPHNGLLEFHRYYCDKNFDILEKYDKDPHFHHYLPETNNSQNPDIETDDDPKPVKYNKSKICQEMMEDSFIEDSFMID